MTTPKDIYGQEIKLGDAVVIVNGSDAGNPRSFQFVTRYGNTNTAEITRICGRYLTNENEKKRNIIVTSSYVNCDSLVVVTKQFEGNEQFDTSRQIASEHIKTEKPEAKKTKINRVFIGKDSDKIYVIRSEAYNQPDHNKSISAMINELMKMEFVTYVSQLNPVRTNKDGSFSVQRYASYKYELNQTQLKKLIGHNTFDPGITLIADPVQVEQIKSNIIFK